MSTQPERFSSGQTPVPFSSNVDMLRKPWLFERKEAEWGMSLYNFGVRSGLESLRRDTDHTIRNEILYMIKAIERNTTEEPTFDSTTYNKNRKKYRRETFRYDLGDGAKNIDQDTDVTALTVYRDYELDKHGEIGLKYDGKQYGIRFDLLVDEEPTTCVIGYRDNDTSFVHTLPGGNFYPDIFPISGTGIPNRLALLYPKSETAEMDMTRDIARRSSLELILTLRAGRIIEQVYDIWLSNIRASLASESGPDIPDIQKLLEEWDTKGNKVKTTNK